MPKTLPMLLAAALLLSAGGALAQVGPPETPAEGAPVAAPTAVPERRELRVGILDDAAPFSARGRFGTRTGFDVDIALALCNRLEADCTLVPYAAEDVAAAFDERRIDLAVATLTPARLDGLVDFTNPYVRVAGRFVVPRDAAAPESADVWGAVAGSAQAEDLSRVEPTRTVRLYANIEEMWIDLALGRLAGVLAPAVTARRDFLSTPVGEPFRFASSDDANALARTAAVAVRQGDDALRSDIDAALTDLLAAPEYEEILSRHLDTDLAGAPQSAS